MKKKAFLFISIVCLLSLLLVCFVACGGDKDSVTVVEIKLVEGTYKTDYLVGDL